MEEGSRFVPYIPDSHPSELAPKEEIKRHILCSGQVYYQVRPVILVPTTNQQLTSLPHQLLNEREQRGLKNVVISRVEQISPVPYAQMVPHFDEYPNADIMWAQVRFAFSLSLPSISLNTLSFIGRACQQRRFHLLGAPD